MNNPIPQGKYIPANRIGNVIVTAGMTPRDNGKLILTGKVKKDAPIAQYEEAVRLAVANTFKAASNLLQEGEHIGKALTMSVYVNAEEGYETHAKIADFASDYLCEQLNEKGAVSRAAIGVASLPGNAPVEVQVVYIIEK